MGASPSKINSTLCGKEDPLAPWRRLQVVLTGIRLCTETPRAGGGGGTYCIRGRGREIDSTCSFHETKKACSFLVLKMCLTQDGLMTTESALITAAPVKVDAKPSDESCHGSQFRGFGSISLIVLSPLPAYRRAALSVGAAPTFQSFQYLIDLISYLLLSPELASAVLRWQKNNQQSQIRKSISI